MNALMTGYEPLEDKEPRPATRRLGAALTASLVFVLSARSWVARSQATEQAVADVDQAAESDKPSYCVVSGARVGRRGLPFVAEHDAAEQSGLRIHDHIVHVVCGICVLGWFITDA